MFFAEKLLSLLPWGNSTIIGLYPMPPPPPSCTRVGLEVPICRLLRGTKKCKLCRDHANDRRMDKNRHSADKSSKKAKFRRNRLSRQNKQLNVTMTQVDILRNDSFAEREEIKEAVRRMENLRNNYSEVVASDLCLHCHDEECQSPCPIVCNCQKTA